MRVIGATAGAKASALRPATARVNYYLSGRVAHEELVQTYSAIQFEEVYAKTALTYYANAEGDLQYDFIIAPGGDPGRV